MAVQVIGTSWVTSDCTRHQARSVGQGNWAVSYLPGRTLTLEQSVAAIRVAEEVAPMVSVIGDYARELGLTPAEAFGMAMRECGWPDRPPLPSPHPRRRGRWLTNRFDR